MSWHLRKQVGIIAYPMYSASVAFLRVRRINIEIKIKLRRTVIAQSTSKINCQSHDLAKYKLVNISDVFLLYFFLTEVQIKLKLGNV